MRTTVFIIIFFTFGSYTFSQSIKDLSFGTNDTFEVLTWNIEWFPKNGQITVDSVELIIRALDVDLLALQEISDTTMFKEMIENLDGYEGYFKSDWFAGLAYIYKSEVIDISDIYEIYITSPYWSAFPRSPMVMEMRFMEQNYVIINNHLKCCGDGILDLNDAGDEETRRFEASNLLKQYIDLNFPNDRVIVLGDLNDILTDNQANNVFPSFINDTSNYRFADMDIAEGSSSGWSYPNWPSHIDHILLTNELFDEFSNDSSDIRTLKIDDFLAGGFGEYDANISDHRPVALKIKTANGTNFQKSEFLQEDLIIYPNPSRDIINITFEPQSGIGVIEIYNLNGQKIESLHTQKGQSSLTWNAEHLPHGIYFVKLLTDNTVRAVRKIVLLK